MKTICILVLGISLLPGIARCIDCSTLPTQFTGNEFPKGNFLTNFNNSCYAIPFGTGNGQNGQGGDMNTVYDKMFYKVDPRYQIIILGSFPNSRYFSITAYDAHGAITQSLLDTDVMPLNSTFTNPYQPGTAFVAGQKYGALVDLGGTPGTIETGCGMSGFNIEVNKLDAAERHHGMNWNTDPGIFKRFLTFPPHIVDTSQHTNPNTAGVLMIRNYLDLTPVNSQTTPYVIVRDVASGCAYPSAYVLNNLQVVVTNSTTGNTWLDNNQAGAHRVYSSYLPQYCYGNDPQNMLSWTRGTEYVPGGDVHGSYIASNVPSGIPSTLAAAGQVMRLRFRLPTTPPTPCTNGCVRSGNEQLRYMSLSFQNPGGATLASVADGTFTKDANGYVTLIVGTGAAVPSWITPSNGYTFLNLTSVANYQNLQSLTLRNILPSPNFNCSGQTVPYSTTVYAPAGGLMGEYLPVVDYPTAATLPQTAVPLVGPNSCGIFPNGRPATIPSCGVVASSTATISTVAPPSSTASVVAVQPQPPIALRGAGLGLWPYGLPFTGTSNYLQVLNTTQNWSAGHTGDSCTVSIDNWASNSISLVANVNQNGMCPLAAGDQLIISVWNPQTLAGPATAAVIVAPN